MNDEPKAINVIQIPGVDTLECVVRNIGENPVLFTKDGKMIGHQIDQMGYEVYFGKPPHRRKAVRLTLLIDTMRDEIPGGGK